MADCPFCNIAHELAQQGNSERVLLENTHAFAIRDSFPVSPGHSLIIPKQHTGSFFELETAVQHAMLALLEQVKRELEQEPPPPEQFTHLAEPAGHYVCSEDPPLYRVTNWEEKQNRKPHSYNIGINDGPEAGQTVPHCHLHLIPRYRSDVKDPRGGVRWVIPDKADYWSAT
ncbi:MAG: HIT family protein [Pseudomonadales bacterium]|nr:HIT family protein [Pseudomonadales bacterium]